MLAVLGHAAAGLNQGETAAVLGVSKATIKSVRGAAIARLGVCNVTAAVAVLARRGEL